MKKVLLIIVLLINVGCSTAVEKDNHDDKVEVTIINKEDLLSNANTFICSQLLVDNYIILDNNYLVSNNNIYNIDLNTFKTYSNGENCEIIENISYDKVVTSSENYFVLDNNVYTTITNNEYVSLPSNNQSLLILSNLEGIVSFYEIKDTVKYELNSEYRYYYVLEDDGNIYEYETKFKYIDKSVVLVNKKLTDYNTDKYGTIYDFKYDDILRVIYSEKGVYILKDNEFILSEDYESYKNDFKYFDLNYIITNENKIIEFNKFITK